MLPPPLSDAPLIPKGNWFEAHALGRSFDHHWGRTIRASEATLFAALTLNFNPLHFNREAAAADGHPDAPLPSTLVFATVQGLSVEDLSEVGGAFLGIDDMAFERPVYPEDTLTARSEVIGLRDSRSNPEMGIVTWLTEGFNQRGERVVSFKRTNLVPRAPRTQDTAAQGVPA
ncbi:Acyl dehydratase [Albimonas donghaensis]|uniref:Acyl dehydratase n=1 Tax=Albimonas donghaensis TaxID=356660 RepID=A0A1H3DU87_9RHOB|nr:MaoC family dehydratase [Albimonas donghaensis]SDX69678.1 Acyl dehydratase [Albimonas donghaensis]